MNAMARAHEIRREAAARWNCNVTEIIFSECLKMAYAGQNVPGKMEEKTQLEKVQEAVKSFDMTAKEWEGMILVINKKGQMAGHVKADGTIKEKYLGARNLMGKLVYYAIRDALTQEG